MFFFSGTILSLLCTLAFVGGAINNDPSQAPAICSALGSNDILVAHEDCTKFYICAWGKPEVKDCPKPLLYNPEKEWCDWPENVKCNREVNKEEKEHHDTGSSEIHFNGDNTDAEQICADAADTDYVVIPHEACNKLYACMLGKPVEYTCTYPLLYNIDTQVCDWPENVDCGNRT